jgi:hypothetical protein
MYGNSGDPVFALMEESMPYEPKVRKANGIQGVG